MDMPSSSSFDPITYRWMEVSIMLIYELDLQLTPRGSERRALEITLWNTAYFTASRRLYIRSSVRLLDRKASTYIRSSPRVTTD